MSFGGMSRSTKRFALATGAALLLAAVLVADGCSPGYLLRAGWEEAKILRRRQPIAEVAADPRTAPAERAKLALVLQARDFAADSLDLEAGESYTLFSRVASDTLALVLSAAPKDRLEPHLWSFPIVGAVPYKGFFEEAHARAEMARLEADGFDTYLRPTAAFSTLGWFNDPLLSTLLRYDSVSLANTVIHEITHNTFYAAGEAAFNESFANFVGARGAIRFFCGRDPAGRECRVAEAAWQDDLRFGRFLSGLVDELEALYARDDLSTAEKVERREGVFDGARRRFRDEVRPALRVSTFGFDTQPLNNATLVARRLYYDRLDLFEEVFRAHGGDLPRTVRDVVFAARGADDPYAAVEALLPPEARRGL